MDPISFVVTTLAGAALKKLADDSYGALKARIVALIGATGVQAVEAKPESPAARALLAEQISESPPALRDAELPELATRVAELLARLPEDESLGGGITVRDIRAGRDVIVHHLQAHPGGGIAIDGLRASGQVRIEKIEAGWTPPSA